jgi:hypothetical protein
LHRSSGVRTFSEAEEGVDQVSWESDLGAAPWPIGIEDSAVTSPFVRSLELEGPTTIFDRPERTAERATSEDELDDSYEAALKKFV